MKPHIKLKNTRKNCIFNLFVIISIILLSNIAHHLYLKYALAKMMIAPIEAYNFTDTAIVDIYVNDKWGGEAGARRGAGGGICCVLIPEKWRPGLVANVKWKKTEDEKWYGAQAPIPMYTRSANLQVLFMRNDKVNVYVMDYWPCSAKHPMPKKEQLCGKEKNNK